MDLTPNTYADAMLFLRNAQQSAKNGSATSELAQLHYAAQRIESLTKAAVAASRQDGESWAIIGNRLGITKQAAQQRYGQKRTTAPAGDPLF